MMLLRFFLFIIFTPLLSFAQVIEIEELESFEKRILSVDSSVLVLFDVDDTLIFPKDKILKKANQNLSTQFLEEYCQSTKRQLDEKKLGFLLSLIFAKAEFELVNENSVLLVRSLQERGIPTLAFTAAMTGKFGVIENMVNWRFEQLQNLGFDFRKTFAFETMQFERTTEDGPPLFFQGILFSSNLPKGEILVAFLEKIEGKFSKIILLDDKRDFLESVELELSKKNIPFEGYLYKEASNIHCPVDIDVAKHQIKTLIEQKRWLSDKEAKESLEALCN